MQKYKPRIADDLLKRKLLGAGAVLIEGPKYCGKTTTALQAAASTVMMGDPEESAQDVQLASLQPRLLLKGNTPRLIDEWQIAPSIWDSVRGEVDRRGKAGQFILTGSAVPADTDRIHHSGTGRFSWLKMHTMSLFESGDSNGSVSIKKLFNGENEFEALNPVDDIEKMAYLVCRGGWPIAVNQTGEIALDRVFDYYEAVVGTDISRVDGVKRNRDRAERLMHSYARHQGDGASYASIRRDMMANDSDTLDVDTVRSYIEALRKIFVIEDLPAWNPNLRSSTAIRTTDTRYFTDPSIAAAALGIGPVDLINDLNTFGLLFESMCIRDLRIYAEALDGKLYHYRDNTGLECDAVIHLRNGSYGLIEIKLGGEENINYGAGNLLKLEEKIDFNRMKSPAFKMVLTARGSYGYKREDGIFVIPVCCLRN